MGLSNQSKEKYTAPEKSRNISVWNLSMSYILGPHPGTESYPNLR
jgi:hypothetical protein